MLSTHSVEFLHPCLLCLSHESEEGVVESYDIGGRAEKFSENLEKVVGDAAVADNLAVLHLSLGRVVKHPQVAQFRARDGASALVTLPIEASFSLGNTA